MFISHGRIVSFVTVIAFMAVAFTGQPEVVAQTGTEDNPQDDQVILDDLIVDGSICAGQDCVNGESFGFDTIRLKENNLRIRFVDTSSTASFPTNDWQLTANDSSNGGANKFSIDDIDHGRTPFTIEASAPSHSLYVDDAGRIGFGTSTPVVELHVTDGDTPTLRLEQDGSSGFTPQTWDLAGNETNFFIRDVTNGSKLPFRVRPDAPTSSIDIAPSGNVGLGTSSPDEELDIESNDGPGIRFTNTGTAGGSWNVFMNSNTGRFTIKDNVSGNTPFKLEDGSNENLFRIGIDTAGATAVDVVSVGSSSGGAGGPGATLQVEGSIEVNGGQVHPDFVFEPNYTLESIADHAAYMWQQKHLPALPKAPEGGKGPVNLLAHQMGVLEELEKAHIYIEQLHHRLKAKDVVLAEIQERLKNLENAQD